jgi:hypothetical protein
MDVMKKYSLNRTGQETKAYHNPLQLNLIITVIYITKDLEGGSYLTATEVLNETILFE